MNLLCLVGRHDRRRRAKGLAIAQQRYSLLYGGGVESREQVVVWTVECRRCNAAWLRRIGSRSMQRVPVEDLALFEMALLVGRTPYELLARDKAN
jgi:hypothetical protein